MATPTVRKTRIVILGGGFGGATLARELEKAHVSTKNNADVTLIDAKDYFEINIATLRTIVQPDITKRSLVKFSDFLKSTSLTVGVATNVTPTEVVLGNGTTVPYDYLVVATGARYGGFARTSVKDGVAGATSLDARIAQTKSLFERVTAAKSVLIAGGGPVGVELAAEIVVLAPGKKVTLVHSKNSLIDSVTNQKVGQYAQKWLQEHGVTVILGDRIPADQLAADPLGVRDAGKYRTEKGVEIEADVSFTAFGGRANTDAFREHFAAALDGNGSLKVDRNLRVAGHENVFAIGDVTDLKELKVGYLTVEHAKLIAGSLRKLLGAKDPKTAKLGTYSANTKTIMLVTLGPNEGMGHLPLIGFSKSGMVAGIKKDLFVGRFRKDVGLAN